MHNRTGTIMEKPFKPTYLYVKTHNVTGLKYFGKTTSNRKRYRGSGTYWLRHLAIHGNDVTTVIIGHFTDAIECMLYALEFSYQNDIVHSKEWANLMMESGVAGGDTFSFQPPEQQLASNEKRRRTFAKKSDEEKAQIRQKNSEGVKKYIQANSESRKISAKKILEARRANGTSWHSEETKLNIGKNNKSGTAEVREKISKSLTGRKNPSHSLLMSQKTGLANKNTRVFEVTAPDGMKSTLIGCLQLRQYCGDHDLAYEQFIRHIDNGKIAGITAKRPRLDMLNVIGYEIKEIKNDKFKKV